MPSTEDASTRERIVQAATDLVMELGYEKTTMRAIADRAGVSLGSAYYYFGAKSELIQGIYARITSEHRTASLAAIEKERSFRKRLDITFTIFLDTCAPYRGIADALLSLAIVPTSPLSPFSPESAPARELGIALYREVVEGSSLRTDPRLRETLPELLWMTEMVITLGWVQDLTPEQRLTRSLVGRLGPLIARLVSLARLKPMRPLVEEILEGWAEVAAAQLRRAASDGA